MHDYDNPYFEPISYDDERLSYDEMGYCEDGTHVTYVVDGKNRLKERYEDETFLPELTMYNGTEPDLFLDLGGDYIVNDGDHDDIDDAPIAIGNSAFKNCETLRTITLPELIHGVDYNSFSTCENLTDINVVEENLYFRSIDGALYSKKDNRLHTVPPAKKGVFVIPDGVTRIEDYAFANCKHITKIIIPESVTHIDSYAFANCEKITEIVIPESVKYIGSCAFLNCSDHAINLTRNKNFIIEDGVLFDKDKTEILKVFAERSGVFNVPYTVTWIYDYTFAGCDEITCVNIPDSVTNISENAFADCKGLKKINISENNPRYSCHDVIIYNKNKTRIKVIPNKAEVDIVIPDSVDQPYDYWDSYFDLDDMSGKTTNSSTNDEISESGDDYKDWGLTSFNNTSFTGVTLPYRMVYPLEFDYCTNLTTVTFYETKGESGEIHTGHYIGYFDGWSFHGCPNITTITLPEQIEHIMGFEADDNNDNLVSPKPLEDDRFVKWSSLNKNAFQNLENIYISESSERYCSVDGVLYSKDKTVLLAVPNKRSGEFVVPDGVTTIGVEAFCGCSELTSITLPDTITSIGYAAFEDCTSLTSINIPNGVTSIGEEAFSGCASLSDVLDSSKDSLSDEDGISEEDYEDGYPV